MFEKKFSRPPTKLLRSSSLSDLTFVCQDGVTSAHQFVIGKHSPFLKKFFNSQYTLLGVTLNQPRMKGLPPTLKERREPCPMVHIHLPDYTVLTVDLLLDLLYTGKTDQCGEIDNNRGQLSIRLLYVDLGIDAECGGLPDIAELELIEVELVRQVRVEEDVKELPSIEAATSTTIDIDAGVVDLVNEKEEDVKVTLVVTSENTIGGNEGSVVHHPLELGEKDELEADCLEILNLEQEEQDDNIDDDDDSELLGVADVDDLLSEDEVQLDFDDETYEDDGGVMDTSLTPDIDDSQCLKEFSKIKLGVRKPEDEPIAEKEKDFIDEVNKDCSDIEELNTSFDFDKIIENKETQLVDDDQRSSLNLIKKIKLEKNSKKASAEVVDSSTTKKSKMELKLSVLSEKKRKRKCSGDEDYMPNLKASKEAVTAKTIGCTVTRARSRDVEEKTKVTGASKAIKGITFVNTSENINGPRKSKSSDDVTQVESISDCFKKLCDKKLNAVEFSFLSVSPEVPELNTITPEVPQSTTKTSKRTSPTHLSCPKFARKPSVSSNPENKLMEFPKPTPFVKESSDTSLEFTCPIQGCSHKHTNFSEKTHPKIYRILKHLISHHLRKDPCGIYSNIEVEPTTRKHNCCITSCSYKSESKTSLFTHMACYHGDLYNRIKSYRRKATSKEEVDIYHSVGEYLQTIWEDWKPSGNLSPTVNLTVKDCRPCDEIFPSWHELRNHILVHHCLNFLDLYISGTEDGGYECEAILVKQEPSHGCNVKFKDKISILNHLASKDHLLIKDKEIVDIALGLKVSTKDTEYSSSNQDDIRPDSASSVEVTTEVEKDSDGSKLKQGCHTSRKSKEDKKRKNRAESFEIFGSPLQMNKDPPSAKERKIDSTPKMENSYAFTQENETPMPESTPHEVTYILETFLVKNQQCKYCAHNYVNDDDLRVHLLEKHADRFKTIPMLEAGEKFYECIHCIRKTKVKTFHMKHLKKEHQIITLDLIKSEEDWKQGVLGYVDFCTERDDSLDYMLQPRVWESKPESLDISSQEKLDSRADKSPVRSPDAKNYVPVPNDPADVPDIEPITDNSFDSVDCLEIDFSKEDITKEIYSRPSSPQTICDDNGAEIVVETDVIKVEPCLSTTSSPKAIINNDHESSDDEVIEEYVSITKRKPPKVKHRPRTTTEFVCKVCDKLFPSGAKVSAHVFMFHLQRMSDTVWHELYTEFPNSNTKVCRMCGNQQERARLAKLHQYSQHKRELKKKMEEKGQDWRNLLDYIQYKVSEAMINEEEVTESEVESRACSRIEVYDNPFYLASGRPEVFNPIPKDDTPPVIPPPEEIPPSCSDQISVSVVVNKQIPPRKCGADSDSDDGVKVCMERRDAVVKKTKVISASPKGVRHMEEKKVEEILPITGKKEDKLNLLCPFSKCNELFEELSILVDHYIASHQQSPLKLYLVNALAPDRFCLNTSNKASLNLLGEMKEVFSCPQCQVQFVELQLQARHVARHSDPAAAQCDHCRNFVKVGEKEQHQCVCLHRGELKRILDLKSRQEYSEVNPSTSAASTDININEQINQVQIPGKVYPCTHRHGGCKESFTEKKELHDHARKCRHRPNTSYACQHAGCSKRYYYKEDYEKHVAKFHPAASEAVPSTSTSSTSVICTPILHTCKECNVAYSSQQNLLDHIKTVHQPLP